MNGFQPGIMVRFTSDRDWVVGEVEEVRKGFHGDHLLVVRCGSAWTGERYLVLSSYAEKVPVVAA